ncbi:MAG: substrate-binding domain-containing protein [Rhizobiaceae bacterium]
MKRSAILLIALSLALTSFGVRAAEMKLAVTTSFHNSGLSDVLLPLIKQDLDLDVHLIIVGTGQALKLGRAGDVDALLVHSKSAEETFVAEGYGIHRREIMYNDFVLIGPSSDPAKISTLTIATDALVAIGKKQHIFVSRGDDSGTHRKEQSLWKAAGLDVTQFPSNWYRAVGSGMGATLNAASAMDGYVMSDRASWLKFKNKGELKLLFSGDPELFNQYAFLPVNAAKHPHIKRKLAIALENWLVSKKAQKIIGAYTIDGELLFIPNAKPKD